MQSETNLLVQTRDVVKRYPLFALKPLSLSLPQGQIMGLVGPNGAGKSTILKLLLGFVRADAGSIRVLGYDVPTQETLVKQQVAFVSEEMRLYGEQTVSWHLQLMAEFFTNWDAGYAAHLLKRFDLSPAQTVKGLSLGARIKTNLVLALARRPKLMVLDEPSTGLDPVARHELTAQLFELMLDESNSVLFSSQHTQDVERLSDTISFIDDGQLISCEEKERYLDQWRRIEVGKRPNVPLPEGLHCLQQNDNHASLVDTCFHPQRLGQLRATGIEIREVLHMTLEEIFIQQVLIRRGRYQGNRA